MLRNVVKGFVASLVAGAASAQEAAPDWSAILRGDAQALHAIYSRDHPGAVHGEDPGFKRALDEGLRQALRRAEKADSHPAYWYAMREYAAGFNDAHVVLNPAPRAPALPASWPGFLLRHDGGRFLLVDRSGEPGAPPRGAVLTSCDGIDAETLGRERVGRFRGLWSLQSQREQFGHLVLVDADNPYALRPSRCLFESGGHAVSVDLKWRAIADAELTAKASAFRGGVRAPIGLRKLDDGGYWVSAGSFSSSGENGPKLRALIGALQAEQAGMRSAPYIVLDVRGNTGGASSWGDQIAERVWGRAYTAERRPAAPEIVWRVSDANIAHVENHQQGMPGFVAKLLAGRMKSARARGEQLWRQPNPFGSDGATKPPRAKPAYAGRVYVVTDPVCVSSCIHALDVWKALGAKQVGRESSANTQYAEVRWAELPSGLSNLLVPMKILRLPRPPSVPHRPEHPFDGDLRDTAALEGFIRDLG